MSQARKLYYLHILIVFISLSPIEDGFSIKPGKYDSNSKDLKPLVYTKLKFEKFYNHLWRPFQAHLKVDEINISRNLTDFDGKKLVERHYYQSSTNYNPKDLTLNNMIVEALDRMYKVKFLPFFMYSYDKPGDEERSYDRNIVNFDKCNHDLDYMLSQIEKIHDANMSSLHTELDPEFMALYDSFATTESGISLGNYHWVGKWDQCYHRRIFSIDRDDKLTDFRSRYCIAAIRSSNWNDIIDRKAAELVQEKYFKLPNQEHEYKRYFRINVGICLPESCESSIRNKRYNDILKIATSKLLPPFKHYDILHELYCLPDENSVLRNFSTSAKILFASISIWLILILFASIIHTRIESHAKKSKFVSIFAIQENINRLLHEPKPTIAPLLMAGCDQEPSGLNESAIEKSKEQLIKSDTDKMQTRNNNKAMICSPNDMIFLNSFRFALSTWVITAHVHMMGELATKTALHFDTISDVAFHFNANGSQAIDYYMALSGFIYTYTLFCTEKIHKMTMVQWIYQAIHRYWRIIPMYMLAFWFVQSSYHNLAQGPNWDYGTSNMTRRAQCEKWPWYYPLTLSTNLHTLYEDCIMTSWYVPADVQMHLIAPIFLLALRKSSKLGWIVGLGSIVLCIGSRFERYLNDEFVRADELLQPRPDLFMRNNWDLPHIYLRPWYRFSAYVVGILSGHYVFLVRTGQHKSILVHSPRAHIYRYFILALGIVLMLSATFSTWIVYSLVGEVAPHEMRFKVGILYSPNPTNSALGFMLVAICLFFNISPKLYNFLSKPIWTKISRIHLIIVLIQIETIFFMMQNQNNTYDHSTLGPSFLANFILLQIMGTVACVLLELPIAQFDSAFIRPFILSFDKRSVSRDEKSETDISNKEKTS